MASLLDAVERPRVIINTNDIPSPEGNNVVFPEHHTNRVQDVIDKLFGLHDQERYQLWPERLVRDALSAPHDVMTEGALPPGLRREDYTDIPAPSEPTKDSTWLGKTLGVAPVASSPADSLIEKAQAVSALAGTGGLAGAGNEAGIALGSGPLKSIHKTPEFKNWFGDSKITNAQGEPLVMYHGTKSDFNTFDLGKHGSGDEGLAGKGFYFTYNPEEASSYAMRDIYGKGEAPNVIPSYISLKNPLVIKNGVLPNGKTIKDYHGGTIITSKGGEAIKKYAESNGHDGVVFVKPDGTPGHAVAFKPEQIKSAIGNSGKFNPKNSNMLKADNEVGLGVAALAQTNKPFYSAVENALTAAKQPKADVQQWLNFLKNQPGVKQEELAHLGLDKLQGSITKDDLLKTVQEGQPQISQVWKGTEQGPFGNAAYDAANNLSHDLHRKYGNGWRLKATSEELKAVSDLEARGEMKNPNPTRHHAYQLSGGENYRELLLTLLEKQPKAFINRDAFVKELKDKYGDQSWDLNMSREEAVKFKQLQDEYLKAKNAEDYNPEKPYKSSHWDEPNVLAHIRMNDRIIDGKKTLHLEEIQSDWHQAGRKRGYKEELNEIKGVHGDNLKINEGEHDWQAVAPDGRSAKVGKGVAKSEQDARDYLARYLNKTAAEKNSEARIAHADKVPNAPFKKTWDELSIKHALTEAIKNGYDQISWTPGEAQAARYDLSKQVDKIAVPMVNYNGTRSVRIDAKDGLPFKLTVNKEGIVEGHGSSSSQFSGKSLDDVVGKEMAEKIMKLEKPDEFSGDDLKVGGKGMKAFYDKMLVDKMNALGKKYGAKVSKANLPVTKDQISKLEKNFDNIAPDIEAQNKYKEAFEAYNKEINRLTDNGKNYKAFNTNEVRALESERTGVHELMVKDTLERMKKNLKGSEVWTLPITDKMKQEIGSKGLPLFSMGLPIFSPVDHNPFESK